MPPSVFLYAGGRRTQRSTFRWTVAGYHPIACRALLKVHGCGSWMSAFALGQKHICIHIRVINSGHLAPIFCVRWFHPVVARLTAATSVGFHSCGIRVSLFGLAINFEYSPLPRVRAPPKRVLRSTLSVYVGAVCGAPEAKLEHPSLSVGRGALRARGGRPHGHGQPPTTPRIPRRARNPRVRRITASLHAPHSGAVVPHSTPRTQARRARVRGACRAVQWPLHS